MIAIVAGIFVLIVALIISAYWFLVVKPEEREQETVIRRVTRATANRSKKVRSQIVKEVKQTREIPVVDAALRHAGRVSEPLGAMLEQAGMDMSASEFITFSMLLAVVAAVLVVVLTKYVIFAVPAALLAGVVPFVFVRQKRAKRVKAFEEQFPDAIELVARALRAGHAFPTGLQLVAEEMKAPVGPEFQILFDQQNFGMSLPDALRAFAARIPLLDARFFVTAVLTQRETGGNLSEILDNLASVIRERFKVKRQVRVISAHGRMTGWILTLLPPILAGVLMFIVPGHVQKLFSNDLGKMMVLIALSLELVGALIIRKIVRIEY